MHPSFSVDGHWYRSPDFEITGNFAALRAGAEIREYDPWSAFRDNLKKYRGINQPYVALLELSRHLDNEAEILEFCRAHGPLGIFGARCAVVRYRALPDIGLYRRVGGEWQEFSGLKAPQTRGEPSLLWHHPLIGHHEVPISRMNDFLAEGTSLQPPPHPSSIEFRAAYREPLEWLRDEVRRFASAARLISGWSADPDWRHSNLEVYDGFWHLRDLAQAAAPAFQFNSDKDRLDEVRVSPSLLSSFALMFLWDRDEGRRLYECENCEKYFVSNEYRSKYCSTTCRNTASSRRYRLRKSAGIKNSSKGEPNGEAGPE